MEITKKTSTNKTNYAPNRNIQYIAIHYTAGVTSRAGSAINVATYFATSGVEASADFIVDDQYIVQYNPEPKNYYCWAVGDGSAGKFGGKATNRNTISIEICSSNTTGTITKPNDAYFYFTDAAVNNAIELTKYLMKQYNIPVSNVIRHFCVSLKPCPGVRGWGTDGGDAFKWNEFKSKLMGSSSISASTATQTQPTPAPTQTAPSKLYRIRKTWADAKSQVGAYSNLDGAIKSCPTGYSVFDDNGNVVYPKATTSIPSSTGSFVVQIDIDDLNIRKGAGTDTAKTGMTTGKGRFTIVEVKEGVGSDSGWGRLKSGAGWISLDYCKRV